MFHEKFKIMGNYFKVIFLVICVNMYKRISFNGTSVIKIIKTY